jgi:hypothetical protein
VGVSQGHREGPVPQDLLHFLQGRSAHDEVARRSVPEIVEPHVLELRSLERLLERRPDLPAAEERTGTLGAVGLKRDQRVIAARLTGTPRGRLFFVS